MQLKREKRGERRADYRLTHAQKKERVFRWKPETAEGLS